MLYESIALPTELHRRNVSDAIIFYMNLQSVRETLADLHPTQAIKHPLFQDPISVVALIVAAVINLLTVVLVITKLHQVDYPVPTHYQSLIGFDQVGSWLQNYRLLAFSVLVFVANTALAAKSFHRNRLVSFFLILASSVVAILALVISSALVAVA